MAMFTELEHRLQAVLPVDFGRRLEVVRGGDPERRIRVTSRDQFEQSF